MSLLNVSSTLPPNVSPGPQNPRLQSGVTKKTQTSVWGKTNLMKNEEQILRQRAIKVAGIPKETTSKEETLRVVEFMLIPEKYCIDSSYVTEVLPLKEITTIPGTPQFVMGVMNARGKIISIVNLKSFLNLNETGITELNKIIVVKHGKMEFGIVADAINGTHELPLSGLSPPPVTIHGIGAEYIKGVTTEGLILLEISAILSSESIIVNQK